MALIIDPMTDGVLRVSVKDAAGISVTDADVVAAVYRPSGKRVAHDVPLSNAGSGKYDLAILPAWSTHANGSAIQGEFRAVLTVTQGGVQATELVKYLVTFGV